MINNDIKAPMHLKLQGLNLVNWTFDVINGGVKTSQRLKLQELNFHKLDLISYELPFNAILVM